MLDSPLQVVYNVHCHVGSLEIDYLISEFNKVVHCHVGSLEIRLFFYNRMFPVHCHVGSLEIRRTE